MRMISPSEILVICLLFIQSSHGYSMGAPDSSCTKMTPGMIFEMIHISSYLFTCTIKTKVEVIFKRALTRFTICFPPTFEF